MLIVGGEGAYTLVAPPEIYDPDTDAFTTTGTLVTPQWLPALTVLLPDGPVLLTGAKYAELFGPTTGTFSETGGLQIAADSSFVMTALGKNNSALALVTGDAGDLPAFSGPVSVHLRTPSRQTARVSAQTPVGN